MLQGLIALPRYLELVYLVQRQAEHQEIATRAKNRVVASMLNQCSKSSIGEVHKREDPLLGVFVQMCPTR